MKEYFYGSLWLVEPFIIDNGCCAVKATSISLFSQVSEFFLREVYYSSKKFIVFTVLSWLIIICAESGI